MVRCYDRSTSRASALLVFGLAAFATELGTTTVLVGAQGPEENNNDGGDSAGGDNNGDGDGGGGLFVNRTHYGYGDYFVYSTTSPISYALYASLLLVVMIISCSIWIYGCPVVRQQQKRGDEHDLANVHVAGISSSGSKKESLLHAHNPYAGVDELLERFHGEVKNSEVLNYDDEEQNSYTRSLSYCGEGENDDDNDNDTAADGRAAAGPKRPPVVDGFYSTTHDDLILEYNEDMYLEFLPLRGHESFCTIQGYGKYSTGNVRVEGLVASTGEAYWYEVPYNRTGSTTATRNQQQSGPVAIARGTFALRRRRQHDNDSAGGGKVQFIGQWYRPTGDLGGHYQLFSHKDVFPSSHYTAPSVAATEDLMDCNSSWGDGSVARMGDDNMEDGGDDDDDHDDVVGRDEVLLKRGDSDNDNSSHASVVFGEDGPRVSNLSNDDWSIPEEDSEIGLGQRRRYAA
jgi:hypothetical protein